MLLARCNPSLCKQSPVVHRSEWMGLLLSGSFYPACPRNDDTLITHPSLHPAAHCGLSRGSNVVFTFSGAIPGQSSTKNVRLGTKNFRFIPEVTYHNKGSRGVSSVASFLCDTLQQRVVTLLGLFTALFLCAHFLCCFVVCPWKCPCLAHDAHCPLLAEKRPPKTSRHLRGASWRATPAGLNSKQTQTVTCSFRATLIKTSF